MGTGGRQLFEDRRPLRTFRPVLLAVSPPDYLRRTLDESTRVVAIFVENVASARAVARGMAVDAILVDEQTSADLPALKAEPGGRDAVTLALTDEPAARWLGAGVDFVLPTSSDSHEFTRRLSYAVDGRRTPDSTSPPPRLSAGAQARSIRP